MQYTQEYKMLFFLQFSQQLKNELDINFILVLWKKITNEEVGTGNVIRKEICFHFSSQNIVLVP